MSTKLHRTFSTRERFVEEFVRRLSERGIELNLPGEQAPPAGTVLHLDLRLEDGAQLIVGTGEVTEGGRPGDAFRVRFLELTKQTRAHLGELVVKAATIPAERRRPASAASSQSLVDLVAGTYGDETPPGMSDNSAVMVPPDAVAKPAAKPAEGRPPGPPPAGKPKRAPRRSQISPALIVVAIIAGAAGAAAQAWFDDLADLIWHLGDEPGAMGQTAVIDRIPTDVAPSDFSDEEAAGSAPETTGAPTGDDPAAEEDDPPQPDATPPATGTPPEGEATADAEVTALGLSPANRVRLITWEEGVDATVITLWGNGSFPADRVSYFEVEEGRPRMLIKLRGIDLPYRETILAVDTSQVTRLRTGFHPQSKVNELHLVLDLTSSDVLLERVERGESSLSFYLGTELADGASAVPAE